MQSREILKESDQSSEPQHGKGDRGTVNANEHFQSSVLKVHIQIVPQTNPVFSGMEFWVVAMGKEVVYDQKLVGFKKSVQVSVVFRSTLRLPSGGYGLATMCFSFFL